MSGVVVWAEGLDGGAGVGVRLGCCGGWGTPVVAVGVAAAAAGAAVWLVWRLERLLGCVSEVATWVAGSWLQSCGAVGEAL